MAALRRSPGGRLPLLAGSFLLAAALIAAQLTLPLDVDDRASAAELVPFLGAGTEVTDGFTVQLFALVVLGVSTLPAPALR
jgi:hypothetical protein